ncbi:hypothetical protein J7E95_34390 [Streptomyces sp. ISL-14]|nr:hypothetical protein [Streptomyces sp. ISL-14]
MSAPRTVTVHTTDHGPVTVPEPAWCLGQHPQDGHRADILHRGPGHTLTFRGRHITDAALVQAPFSELPADLTGREPGVSVDILGKTLNPVGLYELAAVLDSYADRLRDLADGLAVVLAGGEGR